MYPILHSIFSDKSDGILFRCFSLMHIGYILLFVCIGVFVLHRLNKQTETQRSRSLQLLSAIPFYIYMAGFFIMPLAYGEIDIEKLPFHICTAMCVLCFLSRRSDVLKKYTVTFAALGLLSNLGYLIYPAGLMWHQTHPLSYRVMDTLFFHGFMSVYGLAVLVFEAQPLSLRGWRQDLRVIIGMVLWALLGNFCYNGEYGGTARFYNWFFVVRDPFYILPESSAKFIMPLFNTALFFTAQMLVYLIVYLSKRKTTDC